MAEPRQMRSHVQRRAAELSAVGKQIPEHFPDEKHAGGRRHRETDNTGPAYTHQFVLTWSRGVKYTSDACSPAPPCFHSWSTSQWRRRARRRRRAARPCCCAWARRRLTSRHRRASCRRTASVYSTTCTPAPSCSTPARRPPHWSRWTRSRFRIPCGKRCRNRSKRTSAFPRHTCC